MIHLLAVLTGAALMLSAALRTVTSDLARGVPAAQVRFIFAGLLLASSPEAITVLGGVITAWLGLTPFGPVIAAALIAAGIGAVLPHDSAAYKDLVRVHAGEVTPS